MMSRWPGGWPGSTGARDTPPRPATGWLDHAFGTLNLPRVISITDPPNLRSLAVMRRLGMVFDHRAEIEDMGMIFQAVIYTITAEQWRSRAAARRRGVH